MFEERVDHLDRILDSLDQVVVAYSGGVDSSVLLKRAWDRLGKKVMGILADSPSLPRSELKLALDLAESIGVSVEVLKTQELMDPRYVLNPPHRCYFCKESLFQCMEDWARAKGWKVLAYGENADDMSSDRPGSLAASRFRVRAPLKEAGMTKEDVRRLARQFHLAVADKPSSPCLASRVPYGTVVTASILAQIEKGEESIRQLGYRIFRLRHHGDRARLEFSEEELALALQSERIHQLRRGVMEAGYLHVEVDPMPYGKRRL